MRTKPRRDLDRLLQQADASLLDLVDHVLNQGVVIEGEIVLGLANVDLVYLRLSAILCAADRLLAAARPRPGRNPR
jgi:Gas vesicle protein